MIISILSYQASDTEKERGEKGVKKKKRPRSAQKSELLVVMLAGVPLVASVLLYHRYIYIIPYN